LVGGHCIGVDPYYLTAKAEAVGYHPEVILAGRRINDGMGRYVAQQLVRLLSTLTKPLSAARVAILGLTFKENVPDLIVMDLSLPVLDGWEATRRLKADERTCSIPVVALSAHVMEGARMKAIEAGCVGFLPKPCYPSQVSEELKRILLI